LNRMYAGNAMQAKNSPSSNTDRPCDNPVYSILSDATASVRLIAMKRSITPKTVPSRPTKGLKRPIPPSQRSARSCGPHAAFSGFAAVLCAAALPLRRPRAR
jgi:hypothetical protein